MAPVGTTADMDDDLRVTRRAQRDGHLSSNIRLFPKPGPKLYTAVVWWAFGLYVLFLARAPFTPSPEEEQRYSDLMQAAIFSPEARESQQELQRAQRSLDQVHVFGWRWREPYSHLVPPRQAEVAEARARLEQAVRERDAIQSEAKAAVGIWSQYGVDEVRAGVVGRAVRCQTRRCWQGRGPRRTPHATCTAPTGLPLACRHSEPAMSLPYLAGGAQVRERFWKAYQSGKDFAKRMTFWDVLFGVGGGSRDEELYVTLLRWLGQIMMNFTVGLISALFSFMFSLLSMLWEYKVSYISCVPTPTPPRPPTPKPPPTSPPPPKPEPPTLPLLRCRACVCDPRPSSRVLVCRGPPPHRMARCRMSLAAASSSFSSRCRVPQRWWRRS